MDHSIVDQQWCRKLWIDVTQRLAREYHLSPEVTSPNLVPTPYSLRFNTTGTTSANSLQAIPKIDLGLRTDSSLRRDVIIGGPGDDILRGGAGEDWIFGNDGNDVLTGGDDRQASDLLIGGKGMIPSRLFLMHCHCLGINRTLTSIQQPEPTSQPIARFRRRDRTASLYLGGDKIVAVLMYPTCCLAITHTPSSVRVFVVGMGIGTQSFRTITGPSGLAYEQEYLYYQTRDVEETQIELRSGNDTFHADPGFRFLPLAELPTRAILIPGE